MAGTGMTCLPSSNRDLMAFSMSRWLAISSILMIWLMGGSSRVSASLVTIFSEVPIKRIFLIFLAWIICTTLLRCSGSVNRAVLMALM